MRSGEVTWGKVRSHEIRWSHTRSGEVTWGQVRSHEVRWGHMRPGEVKWDQVRSNEARWGQMRPGEVTWHTSQQEKSSHGKLYKTSDIIFHGYLPSQTWPVVSCKCRVGKFLSRANFWRENGYKMVLKFLLASYMINNTIFYFFLGNLQALYFGLM